MLKDSLKKAMLKYAPELTKDYKSFVKGMLGRMKEALGPGLPRVYSSTRWARNFMAIRGNIKKARHSYFPKENDKIPYIIDSKALNKNAKKYGERVALEWYNKMILKLGDLSDVKVLHRSKGGDITVTGKVKGHAITIDQQRIINVSSRGTLFHQFPARIYVDGKFMSEANYRKHLRKK